MSSVQEMDGKKPSTSDFVYITPAGSASMQRNAARFEGPEFRLANDDKNGNYCCVHAYVYISFVSLSYNMQFNQT